MLSNIQISRLLHEVSLQMKHQFEDDDLRFIELNNRGYSTDEFPEFKRDLLEAGNKIKLLFMEYTMPAIEFTKFINTEDNLVLVFKKDNNELIPALITQAKKKHIVNYFNENNLEKSEVDSSGNWLTNENGDVIFFVIFSYKALVSEHIQDQDYGGKKLTPVNRLWRMLLTEKKDILYILFYGVLVGLIGLVLPLGIQTTVELISGGVFFSSVYLLIAIVILGVLVSGGLQVIQISLVEYLQRRIFTKASFEFAFRIPRMKSEAIFNNYAPELINRFFDIMTIQKALPKVLIDLSAGLIQIFFGLLLLSLYHPSFVFFSAALVAVLTTIFYLTGAKGLDSSIQESKYKYKVAQWLEELARALNSFKLAGNTDLPLKRTDATVNKYLLHRRTHFAVLVTQYSFMVIFKAIITGGLLIVGTILVVNREITLGQFVASEVIIILTLSAVEKIITYMDIVYDLLTAVDKVAQVTDIPLEKSGGIDLPKASMQAAFAIDLKNVKYKYPSDQDYSLKGISLSIKAGEHVCISGPGGSGKTTLMNIISGIHAEFDGIVTINNYSIRDLDLTHLRDKIGKNISQDDIFDGTILENITVGKPMESVDDAINALRQVNLYDDINKLYDGLNTHLVSGGKGLSNSFAHKLILARCLAKKPSLILLHDFFTGLKRKDKLELIQCLSEKTKPWTIVAVSNDPVIMASFDRIIVLNDGEIEAEGSFEELLKENRINNYID